MATAVEGAEQAVAVQTYLSVQAYLTATSASSPTAPSAPSTTYQSPNPGEEYALWSHVAVCEEGGWGSYGFPAYPNSLGIMAQAWYAHGGGSDLSPSAQIAVAESLIDSLAGRYIQGTLVYPGWVPDANGCSSW